MRDNSSLLTLIKSLPEKPGVYEYFDADGKIIYVGKAKNLKKRVGSYFTREQHENAKTHLLVKKIADIKFIVVGTEYDALLLENNLIKKHQPRYNVMLKDDKTYPWLCISNEHFPRVFATRNPVKDGSQYFGPYASARKMYSILDLIKKMYPLRTCRLNLTQKNISAKKFKICLEYHIGNCLGPCEGLQTEKNYDEGITHIRNILRGNFSDVVKMLKTEMQQCAEKLDFENAEEIREKIDALENFRERSSVVSSTISDVDVFSIVSDEKSAYIGFFHVSGGAIVQGHTIELKKRMAESDAELLPLAIVELRERFGSKAKEIIVPFLPETELPHATFTIPERGDKSKLLKLAWQNAEQYRKNKEVRERLADPGRHVKRILQTMKNDLRLAEEPRRIECFDNSNLQGTNPVSAMTVFINAKPSKKEYRHFNVKTVEGPDDFATMEEVIFRRYKRVTEEQQDLPQLIVIDGGKGQLSAAMNSLEKLGLRGKIAVIGIAKRLEEIYYPDDPIPLYLDKKSETLRIIQHIRDEAHRFGITHHRKRRSKSTIRTQLTEIPGISEITAKKLLSEFKSVKQVKEKSLEEIAEVIGNAKAKAVKNYFTPQAGGIREE